jgi:hypothetical protein
MINPIVRGGSSAAALGRSSSTVRRGLRRASDPGHPIWLSQRGAQELIRLDAEAFNALGSTANLLSDTLTDRSGRRGLVGAPAAGHCRARVDTHWALHLGRLGARTSIVSAARPRTRRCRPYPHRCRVSPHPRRGQRRRPSVRVCSADLAAQTMIIER